RIVIGIMETANGNLIDVLPDAENSKTTVRDRLADLISPPPRGVDIRVVSRKSGGGHGLLITVPKSDQLHAVKVKSGAWAVYVRTGSRVHPLGWSDIVARLNGTTTGAAAVGEEVAIEKMCEDWRKDILSKSSRIKQLGGLILCLQVFPEQQA